MYLAFAFISVFVGFVFLVKGADYLVDGASDIAKRYGVSDLIIGLTIVAFGTSMPETIVNLISAIDGTSELALTNIIGSNIINTYIILGAAAVIWPVASQVRARKIDIPMDILASCLILFFALLGGMRYWSGWLLIIIFSIYLFFMIRKALRERESVKEQLGEVVLMPKWKALAMVIGGLIGLIGGGELIVKSAVYIATSLGVSQAIIGLTIVAVGTSLPELATTIIAALRHNCDLALGCVLGSKIFNIFFSMGLSACICPLPNYDGVFLDSGVLVASSVLTWLFVMTNKRKEIKRWGGLIFLVIYGCYLGYRLYNL